MKHANIPLARGVVDAGASFKVGDTLVRVYKGSLRGPLPLFQASVGNSSADYTSSKDISAPLALLGTLLEWYEKKGHPYKVGSLELAEHVAPNLVKKIREYPKDKLVLLLDNNYSKAKAILAREILKED